MSEFRGSPSSRQTVPTLPTDPQVAECLDMITTGFRMPWFRSDVSSRMRSTAASQERGPRLLDVLDHDALDVGHRAADAVDGVRAGVVVPVVHALRQDLRRFMVRQSSLYTATLMGTFNTENTVWHFGMVAMYTVHATLTLHLNLTLMLP